MAKKSKGLKGDKLRAKLNTFLSRIPFLNPTKVLGLETSETFVKIVEIDIQSEKPLITYCNIISLTTPPKDLKEKDQSEKTAERIADILMELYTAKEITAKEISFVISSGSVFSRKIKIPKLPAKELENGIRWEASNQIPFSLDSSYFDWQHLREVTLKDETKNDEYMIAAASKKTVDDLLAIVSQAHLRPLCIGIPIFAIFNLAVKLDQFNSDERIAIVDLGARRTNIIIVQNKKLIFAREIPVGDDNLNEVIASEFAAEQWDVQKIDEFKNQKHLISLAMSDEQDVADLKVQRLVSVLRPLLERLFGEVRRSFDYFKEQDGGAQVDRIVLSGKGVQTHGMESNFKKCFNMPVEVIKIEEVCTVSEKVNIQFLQDNLYDFGLIIGLILGVSNQVNFLSKEHKERRPRLKQLFFAIVGGLIVLLILGFIMLEQSLKIGVLQSQIRQSNEQMEFIIPQITSFNEICSLYLKDKEFVDTLRVRQILLANAMKELSNIVPSVITFTRVYLREDGWMDITGYVFDDTEANISSEASLTDFIIAIENSPFFSKVKLVSSDRGDAFEVPHSVFSISCKIISRKEIKEI